ncbi:hypothetical protein ACETU7_00190 [Rhodococcus sp. 3Y1]
MRIAAAVIGFLTIAAVSGCSASSDSPRTRRILRSCVHLDLRGWNTIPAAAR